MRKTKGTVVLLLILAIFALGIGYAAASSTLKINGELGAKADNANFKVKFATDPAPSNQTPNVKSTTVTPVIETDVTSDLLATFSVTGFTSVGDSVVLTYTVKNESEDIDATVSTADLETFNNSNYFDVVSSFASGSVQSSTTIAANSSATLYVTVSCIKTPTADVVAESTEGIVTLTATPVAQ